MSDAIDMSLSPQHRTEERFPHTIPIFATESQARAEEDARFVARMAAINANTDAKGRAQMALHRYQQSRHVDPKTEAKLQKGIDKNTADRKAIDEERQKPGVPQKADELDEWLSKATNVNAPYVHAETTDEAQDGKSPLEMLESCGADIAAMKAKREDVIDAPVPLEEYESAVADSVVGYSSALTQALAIARRPEFDDRYNRFKTKKIRLPQLAIADGLGGGTRIPDSMGLLCEVFGEQITAHLMKIAREQFDFSGALDAATREARFLELSKAIEAVEYKAEFWYRECRRKGFSPKIRFCGSNMLAVLDLKRVR